MLLVLEDRTRERHLFTHFEVESKNILQTLKVSFDKHSRYHEKQCCKIGCMPVISFASAALISRYRLSYLAVAHTMNI
jgi:hypothetical protein